MQRKSYRCFNLFVIITVLLGIVVGHKAHAETFPGPYRVTAYKVLDGDSVVVSFNIWFGQTVSINARLRGIDEPETRRGVKGGKPIKACEIAEGKAAKEYLKAFMGNSGLRISNIALGAFNKRVVADLHKGSIDVAGQMLSAGHALPYSGKRAREAWQCGEFRPTKMGVRA